MNRRDVFVLVMYDFATEQSVWLREVCAGLEEEGVPYRVEGYEGENGCAVRLAAIAAGRSPLQVGIGLGSSGELAVHHEKLHNRPPYLQDVWQNGRILGKNAGRLVKGLPLYRMQKGRNERWQV